MAAKRSRAATPAGFPHRLIGLAGTNAAGKGEVAAYLMKKGYAYLSLSDEIRDELRRKGGEITRDTLIATGNALRRRHGADILARRVMKKVTGPTVIDSIRNAREVAYLRRQEGFILVAVDAPLELRYERSRKRGRAESAATLEEFAAKERKEWEGGPNSQQVRRCLDLADVTLLNDGSLKALYRQIEERL
jgi:dephospho-CoA kinase